MTNQKQENIYLEQHKTTIAQQSHICYREQCTPYSGVAGPPRCSHLRRLNKTTAGGTHSEDPSPALPRFEA